MTILSKSFLFSLLLIFGSCEPKIKENKQPLLKKVSWLEGTWQNQTEDGLFKEIWKPKNKSTLEGASYFIANNDTLFEENIALEAKNDLLYYSVSLPKQSKPVVFVSTQIENHYVVFENKANDYPKKITYQLVNQDSIYAEISNDTKKEGFPFKRLP